MHAFSRSGRFKVIVTIRSSSATLMSSSVIRMKVRQTSVCRCSLLRYLKRQPEVCRTPWSLSSKLRLALVDVRVQTFFRIFGLEQLLLQFTLERQRGFEWNLSTGLHRALDSSDGTHSFVGRRELPCVVHHLLHELRVGF